jgi:PBP1b-binding outer membrane lipoprotein LpoB
MKYLSFLMLLLVLQGCSSPVPVKRNFPQAPDVLLEPCPPSLKSLNSGAKLSDIATTIVENYTTYHECAIKNKTWIEWYQNQKKIFEETK